MSEQNVLIYISDHNKQCEKLINQMDTWNVSYETKNVTKNSNYMRELQELDIYGTPATFIDNEQNAILGFQKNKIKRALGIWEN